MFIGKNTPLHNYPQTHNIQHHLTIQIQSLQTTRIPPNPSAPVQPQNQQPTTQQPQPSQAHPRESAPPASSLGKSRGRHISPRSAAKTASTPPPFPASWLCVPARRSCSAAPARGPPSHPPPAKRRRRRRAGAVVAPRSSQAAKAASREESAPARRAPTLSPAGRDVTLRPRAAEHRRHLCRPPLAGSSPPRQTDRQRDRCHRGRELDRETAAGATVPRRHAAGPFVTQCDGSAVFLMLNAASRLDAVAGTTMTIVSC